MTLYFLFCSITQGWARPDFLDTMSRQFFGISSDNNEQRQQQYQSSPDPFMEMFGSSNQQVSQRSPPPNHQHSNRHSASHPHRQGYYPPPHVIQQQVHHPHVIQQHVNQPHAVQQHVHPAHQQQIHPPYNGPPPVYGQQQGFGQRRPDTNETNTEGFPPDNPHHKHAHQLRHPYPATDYQPPHHNQQIVAVEYPKPPATVIEYQTQYPQHTPQQVEYHHIPQQPVAVEEHGPALEIHTGNGHAYHEPPTHVEYHHPPEEEYHHPPPHKPKGFHISFNQPSPDYKIIDRHIKIPPVKFRFHINPKIVITSNTKDPLEKKHHDDEHDLEPYPPPDAFSDHDAPPSLNKHVIEHYPVKHHYPVEHHAVNPYATGYPEPKNHYSIGHHAVAHHPTQEYVYDLSHGHSHLNPHRSLGHYEPTFKVKTKPIIFTEPPPTPPTTTTRATTTTARTTTARTTTTTRPTRRARISARNPGFSVAFTQASTTGGTTEASTSTSTTTRRSIFRNNSERERENDGISARRDEVSTSAEIPQSTKSTTTSSTTTTTTSATPKSTSITSTTTRPSSSSSTYASTESTTTSTSTPRTTTTSTTTTTTPKSITTTTTTTSTVKPITTATTTTTLKPTIRPRVSPAEETTIRSTTFSVDANEIDMRKATETPRRRPEPLLKESTSIERSGLDIVESSESVKVIETTMLIDGKNQTVRFYYITHPVKLPLDVFQKMTGQSKDKPSGVNVIKIRDKRYAVLNRNLKLLQNL